MSEKTPDQIVSEYWGHFHGGTMSFETVVKEIVRSEREASERNVEKLKKALEEAKSRIGCGCGSDIGTLCKNCSEVDSLAASTLEEVTK